MSLVEIKIKTDRTYTNVLLFNFNELWKKSGIKVSYVKFTVQIRKIRFPTFPTGDEKIICHIGSGLI